MSVNKGLKSLAESSPGFSNQALENAINQFKVGWVLKGFQLDSVIESNAVLTTSQKTDIKEEINNVAHINMGSVLGDLLRHTNSILDATIVPVPSSEPQTATFVELLQTVQAIQTIIPNLFGVSASDKSRGVNDHFGTLNNKFVETEDSTAPVFTTLREAITFINNAELSADTALQTAYDNLKNFINSVVADSTDFQQTLDTFSAAVATAHTNLNNALASEPYLSNKTKLIETREKIIAQVSLENRNLSGIRDFITALTNHSSFASLAQDETLKKLMLNISQNKEWKNYFENYTENSANLNPLYTINSDSDKSAVVEQVLRDRGLPDVLDSVDLDSVSQKAQRDNRINTANYDRLTVEQQITQSCEQLAITTANRSIYNQSQSLLDNMNQHDRDQVATALDLNESSNTLS